MFGGTSNLLTGLGTFGVALAAIGSLWLSMRARKDASEARKASPAAVMENLRVQVHAVVEAHEEAVRRHITERAANEAALRSERARADGAELVAMRLQGQLAEMKIDLAAARADLTDLRARFDASIVSKTAS